MDDSAALRLFETWFVRPLEGLDQDGGWVALLVALPLYERLIRARLGLKNEKPNNQLIYAAVASDLHLSVDQARNFWDIFRNGLMHAAMPKEEDGKPKYMLTSRSLGEPRFVYHKKSDQNVILIEPIAFKNWVLQQYLDQPRLIAQSQHFPWPQIQEYDHDDFEESEES